MMIGEYPCCGAPLLIEMPERTPAYAKDVCPSCGATVWHRFSRIDPASYTEDDFAKEFLVDEAQHIVSRRRAES